MQTIFRASALTDVSEFVFSGSDKYKRPVIRRGFLAKKLARAKRITKQMNRKCGIGKGGSLQTKSARAAVSGLRLAEVTTMRKS
ncbi:hypothetical protein Dda_7329 [Drechslerella dactyloides]|uniref:Uncharacterized protein n=1 Tax=Drechslerella dactyloides TaxID=74499 RepID=A0AAD6NGN0_DREDA|nr:hypothetical protein Dda_7329 [Drechslerella dactyloides]